MKSILTPKSAITLLGLRFLLFLPLLLIASAAIGEGPPGLPEDPLKGRRVFEAKSCIKCHTIQADRPGVGPDLGKSLVLGSFLDLAADMWNHSPRMSDYMRQNYIQRPEFTAGEFQELATFLYYLRYLGEPGNLKQGKRLLSEKGCLNCHALAGQGGNRAADLEQMTVYASPLFLAQAMWNHGPEMEAEMRSLDLTRPRFAGSEIVDLGAYIRSLTREGRKESVYMTPGNPRQGELLFIEKGCADCHSVHGKGGLVGPDLGITFKDCSVTEMAGIMWNHGPEMWQWMSELGLPAPTFNGAEMADVIAYIFYVKFAGESGDSERGRTVFQEMHCIECHVPGGSGSGPDLTLSQVFDSPYHLAAVLWNHAPKMEKKLVQRNLLWPEFKRRQMANLYAFLNSITR